MRVSRRELLRTVGAAAGVLAAGGVLQACGGGAAPASSVASPSQAQPSAFLASPGGTAAASSQQASAAAPSSPGATGAPVPSKPAALQSSSPAAPPASSPVASQSAAPAAAASAPVDWQAQLDKLTAGAKQEGSINIIIPPGDFYRQVTDAFTKKYGVAADAVVVNGTGDLTPKLTAEQQAGQYLHDVCMHAPGVQFLGLGPLGDQAPLKQMIILPEVVDDSK